MPISILATKLYIPPPRAKIVLRPRLIERLNEGLRSGHRLTLISASAGFGKTTLVSEWVATCGRSVAWLSLDEGDGEPVRFIAYLIAALQTIKVGIGENLLAALQSHQPPAEAILTELLNEISTIPDNFLLVLDDYHSIDSQPVDQSLIFLIEHQTPQMHLVIATREDPSLPLSRLRARVQLTELRAADLRFTPAEAADFLNQVMGLNLAVEDIAAPNLPLNSRMRAVSISRFHFRQRAANKACTRCRHGATATLVGVCAFSGSLRSLKLIPIK